MQIDVEKVLASELKDDEKIDIVAASILTRYLPAFEALANAEHYIQEE